MTETTTVGRRSYVHPRCGADVPEPEGLDLCERHSALWDADCNHDELAICAGELLPPLIEFAHLFGNGHLEETLSEDLERAREGPRAGARWPTSWPAAASRASLHGAGVSFARAPRPSTDDGRNDT